MSITVLACGCCIMRSMFNGELMGISVCGRHAQMNESLINQLFKLISEKPIELTKRKRRKHENKVEL